MQNDQISEAIQQTGILIQEISQNMKTQKKLTADSINALARLLSALSRLIERTSVSQPDPSVQYYESLFK